MFQKSLPTIGRLFSNRCKTFLLFLVVEIKKDDDDSKENVAKNRDAQKHFEIVNSKRSKHKYHFYFLSPDDYGEFFKLCDKIVILHLDLR